MTKDIAAFTIEENATLLKAMKQLDETPKKVLFVVRENRLVASLTDGDIRRWLLGGGSLEAEIQQFANYRPGFVSCGQEEKALQLLRRKDLTAVPIVDEKGCICDILFRDGEKSPKKAACLHLPVVIMAGGLGTRLYPYTKILPKPLIPVGEIPITEHIIHLFRQFGCSHFYLIVNHKKSMIKAYFNEIEKDYELSYVDEDTPLGTGGGIGLLRGEIKKTFILTNCDTLIREDFTEILKEHQSKGSAITMICSLKNYLIPYGVVETDGDGCITSIKEKPQLLFFTNTGTYIVEPKVMELIGENESIGFPEIVGRAQSKGWRVGVFPIGEKKWLDMGQFGSLEEMRKQLDD